MSTTETRRPLAEAEHLANLLAATLAPACERIAVAGSIRRRRPDVGDLELVAVSRQIAVIDLFGEPTGALDSALEVVVGCMLQDGDLAPRLTSDGQQRLGAKYKALVYGGMAVDLFIVTAETWGVQFLIRTGPAAFSHRLVTRREQGGWLPNHLRVREGRLWGTDGQPLDTPSEESVFAAIGRAWIAPEARQ